MLQVSNRIPKERGVLRMGLRLIDEQARLPCNKLTEHSVRQQWYDVKNPSSQMVYRVIHILILEHHYFFSITTLRLICLNNKQY